jgi:VanZ family protein
MSTMRLASIILLAYWGLIFVGTHLPSARMPSLHASDKVYHFVAFAGLSFLLCWAIPSSRVSWVKILIIAAAIAITYAVLDEWTQQFIPGRTCDIWDVSADSIGVAMGLTCYTLARCLVSRIQWVQRLLVPNTACPANIER